MKKIFTCIAMLISGTISLMAAPKLPLMIAPTTPSTNLTFPGNDGDRIGLQWSAGNGAKRIVIAKKSSAVTATPVNGNDYNASGAFGAGNEIAPGEFVVYDGSGTAFNTTNLSANTTYYFAIFEYNGAGTTTEYLLTSLTGSKATLAAPGFQPINLSVTNINGHSMSLNWANDLIVGSGRIVLVREGSPVNVNPVDLANYTANANFGAGSQIGTGNFVVYKGNGLTVNVKDLEPNRSYHFAIFEYNGSQGLVFNTNNPPRISATTAPRPTVNASLLNFLSIEGNRFGISMTGGNGARRLIIVKQGSPVNFVPQDGVVYTGSTTFGSGQEVAPGEFVLSAGISGSYNVIGLAIGTTYHLAVFEYDGDGATAAYLTNGMLTGSQATVSAPTTAASNIIFSNILSSSVNIQWTNGDGAKRLVVMRRDNPVSILPQNLSFYSGSASFGSGTTIGGGYSVFTNTGNSVTVTGLTAGATYHVTVYEYNGGSYPVYYTTAAPTSSFSTVQAPTQPSSFLQFTNIEGNRMHLQWTNGNGNRRIVVARAGAPVTYVPVDNTTYTASPIFGSGQQVAPGEYVIYNNGVNPSITFSNLLPGTTYYFAVYEYNFLSANSYFLANPYLNGNKATVAAPTNNSTNLNFTTITGNSLKLNWTNGNGAARLVIAKKGAPVDASPVNFTGYSSNSVFGSGTELGTDNFVVFNGNGNNVTMTGLEPSTTYHFMLIEYNGATFPVYLNTSNPVISQQTAARPSVSATAMNYMDIEGNKIRVRWTNGNGARRILIGKQGSPVTAVPSDGSSYSSNNAFGSGQEIAPGEFVLSDNTFAEVNVSGLQPNSVYHFAVFEYDGTAPNTRYISAGLNGSQSTSVTPTLQANNILFSSIASNTVNVNWASGNGSRRILVARKGAPVNAVPADLQYYTANGTYGTAATLMAPENYAIYSNTGSSSAVSSLASGTTYHFAVFEYNGFSAPVYNQQLLATGSVTTLGAPTDQTTSAVFTATANNTTVKLSWLNGSGQRRLVLLKEEAAVDAAPVNNTTYTGNSAFGGGEQLGTGNYVVYAGMADNVTITNLTPGKIYHAAIFEYNSFPTGALYLTANPARNIWAGGPLPISLLSFSGKLSGSRNVINWQTTSEVNSSYFSIERSADGVNFTGIGQVNANGNSSSMKNYRFNDENPPIRSFYRLRSVDLDGRSTLSKVIVLERQGAGSMQVYPTAVSSSVNISVGSDKNQAATILIFDALGKLLVKKEITVTKGTNTVRLPLTGLTAGNYYLHMSIGEEKQTAAFIKL
jgi:Secretion system C-terminal sorting domain